MLRHSQPEQRQRERERRAQPNDHPLLEEAALAAGARQHSLGGAVGENAEQPAACVGVARHLATKEPLTKGVGHAAAAAAAIAVRAAAAAAAIALGRRRRAAALIRALALKHRLERRGRPQAGDLQGVVGRG